MVKWCVGVCRLMVCSNSGLSAGRASWIESGPSASSVGLGNWQEIIGRHQLDRRLAGVVVEEMGMYWGVELKESGCRRTAAVRC